MTNRFIMLCVAPLITIGALAASSGSAWAAETPKTVSPSSVSECTTLVNDPHWSTGAGGMIAKATIQCASAQTVAQMLGNFYRCDAEPMLSVAWLNKYCYLWTDETNPSEPYRLIRPVEAKKKYTMYAPPLYAKGLGGSGYFVLWTDFTVQKGGVSTHISKFSTVVHH